jgi:transposase
VHVTCDGLGNPLHFALTGAQAHDMTQAEGLLTQAQTLAEEVEQTIARAIADKGYDAEPLRALLRAWGIEPVIPYRSYKGSKPADKPPIDWHGYKERHLVECFINRIKHYRRIFTRFDKLACRYLGFLSFVAALVWLR